ncbi:hypothetical protein SDRG_16297 [Saprolegnia diclina VS20]|uniref:DDE-1 domain-containing protein n=1 Tax=Saprolegnia diclina (strain VS20) TaxID=1156394 RepID=T0R1H4_SAPDV|nr:hypothetical protein SDRG_16297 [Saprolegnia diclina VS20]EQC25848.1 hypothetical protein SDRG_16297 [Saprolegnia diclina VS20]|eukprot:XP_008620723.1 hypothetical protein SDRG_16297 [Saprolegnia diclina VS20]
MEMVVDDSLLLLPSTEEPPHEDLLHTQAHDAYDVEPEEASTATKTRKRERLTLGQKRQVVDLASSHQFTHRELAEKFQVGRTTITNICKNTELIRNETDSADLLKKRRKTTKCTYDLKILDEALHKWRMEIRVSNPEMKLTGAALQQKAIEFAQAILHDEYARLPEKIQLALSKFGASNGWLDGYRTRFGNFSSRSTHEQAAIKQVDYQTRLRELHRSFDGVEPCDIWTGGEFALVFKPSHVMDKGRCTVSLFANAAGDLFDMQVIGIEKGGTPVEMDGLDLRARYRILYGYSKTGLQVATTSMAMLKALNQHAKALKRTFHVVLDSAVPHVKAAMMLDALGDQRTFFLYDQLRIYFLPPHLSLPKCHPLHMGIIACFKAKFRYEMLDTLYTNYRHATALDDATRVIQFKLKTVFHWLAVALHSVPSSLVLQAWVASGLLPATTVAKLPKQPPPSSDEPYVTQLDALLREISLTMPAFLQWVLGTATMSGADLLKLEAKESVNDPGVDETQIIRSVLLKHDFLTVRRGTLDDALDVLDDEDPAFEMACPDRAAVLESLNLLKRYLRLAPQDVPTRMPAIAMLNDLKAHLGGDEMTV